MQPWAFFAIAVDLGACLEIALVAVLWITAEGGFRSVFAAMIFWAS